ncbi:MAG TPA: GYD domain-containing protein [Methanoregulaceae archaeon]|nr:GYD domain-containing protein [Methanoregulaceae archaeon]
MRIHENQREHHLLRTTLSSLQNTSLPQYPTDAQSLGRLYALPKHLYLPIAIPLIMPLFIILGKLSDKAIEKMKEAKMRDQKAEQIIHSAGGTLISHYYTFGRYDFVTIVELPSTEALAKVVVEIAKYGTVSTETMTAILPEQIYAMAKGT